MLAACGARPDSRICTTPATLIQVAGRDPQQKSDSCVHRWAYRLARSNEAPAVVADAVMGACWDTLFPVVFASYDSARTNAPNNDPEVSLSMRTGREVPLGARVFEDQRAKALFHVVQARAGNCATPE
jgi:hypothetical protein